MTPLFRHTVLNYFLGKVTNAQQCSSKIKCVRAKNRRGGAFKTPPPGSYRVKTQITQNHKIVCFMSWRYGYLKSTYRNYSFFVCTPNMLVFQMIYNLGVWLINKKTHFLFNFFLNYEKNMLAMLTIVG